MENSPERTTLPQTASLRRSGLGSESRHRTVHRVAKGLLPRIVEQIEIQLVHHVCVAEVPVWIGEGERTARAGRAEGSDARAERDVRARSEKTERVVRGEFHDFVSRTRELRRRRDSRECL